MERNHSQLEKFGLIQHGKFIKRRLYVTSFFVDNVIDCNVSSYYHANMIKQSSKTIYDAILTLNTPQEVINFFKDLLTIKEIEDMEKRFAIANILSSDNPPSYLNIAEQLQTSTATVTRVNQSLHNGANGYQTVIRRLKE